MTVVPDSIEPVTGWKAMDVIRWSGSGGIVLCSPQQRYVWKPGEAAEAWPCMNGYQKWVATDRPPKPVTPPSPSLHALTGAVMSTVTVFGERPPERPPCPALLLPGYWRWSWEYVWEPRHEEAASTPDCGCGFHIARDLSLAVDYANLYDDFAIVQMFGWGQTVVHNGGWRTSRAYPAVIYTDSDRDLSAYGVPVLPLSELDGWEEEKKRRCISDVRKVATQQLSGKRRLDWLTMLVRVAILATIATMCAGAELTNETAVLIVYAIGVCLGSGMLAASFAAFPTWRRQ